MAYSQNDPRWKNDKLGKSTTWTMGEAGCLVTAGANVLKGLGHDITPGDLNRLATDRGLINASGNVVRFDFLQVLFPDVCRYVETKEWPAPQLTPLEYFDVRHDLNTEIITMIDYSPQQGVQTHFMRTVGWDGGTDVLVDDSWDGARRGVNHYGQRWNPAKTAAHIIFKAIKYVKVVPAPAPPAPEPAPAPAPAPTPPAPAPAPAPTPPASEPTPAPQPEPPKEELSNEPTTQSDPVAVEPPKSGIQGNGQESGELHAGSEAGVSGPPTRVSETDQPTHSIAGQNPTAQPTPVSLVQRLVGFLVAVLIKLLSGKKG